MSNWDFMLCADLHFRDTIPVCRKDRDDFVQRVLGKWSYILSGATVHQVSVLVAGDFFDHWKPSWILAPLLTLLLRFRNRGTIVYGVAGQHDLPNHNQALYKRSALRILECAGAVTILNEPIEKGRFILYGAGWAQAIPKLIRPSRKITDNPTHHVLVTHRMVWKNKPYPTAPSNGNVSLLLKETKGYSLVVTGDNHKPFTKGRVVNCGSMVRSSVAQYAFRPRAYLCRLVHNGDPVLKRVYLPIAPAEQVIDRVKKENQTIATEEMEDFIRSLQGDWDVGLNFRDNLKKFLEENDTSSAVKELIWKALDNA